MQPCCHAAAGVVKLWDVRMGAEVCTLPGPKAPANKCAFDPSGKVGKDCLGAGDWCGLWLEHRAAHAASAA
jgi:hypothetical protein